MAGKKTSDAIPLGAARREYTSRRVGLSADDQSPIFPFDPGLRFLFENRLSRRTNQYVGTFAVLVLMPFVLFLLVAVATDSLYLEGDSRGFFEDPVMMPLLLTLWAAVILTRRVLGMVGGAFDDVWNSVDQTAVTRPEYAGVINTVLDIIDGRRTPRGGGRTRRRSGDGPDWYLLFKRSLMVLGLAIWIWFVVTHYFFIGYNESVEVWRFGSHPVGFAAAAAVELLLLVFIWPVFVYKIIALIYAMNIFFKRIGGHGGFKLRPISPDGAGGLGKMGRLALNMEYVFLPFVVTAIIGYYSYGFLTIGYVLMPGLALCLFAVFWVPLLSAHAAMEKCKQETLNSLQREFNDHYDYLLIQLESDGASLNKKKASNSVDSIQKLHYLYDRTRKMPVWPFDMRIVRRFTATVLVPALVVAIPEIVIRL